MSEALTVAPQETTVAPAPPRAMIKFDGTQTIAEDSGALGEVARGIFNSGMAPKSLNTVQKVWLACLMLKEHRLPFTAIGKVMEMNGVASLHSEAFTACVMDHPLFDHKRYEVIWEGEDDINEKGAVPEYGNKLAVTIQMARIGGNVQKVRFSVVDAKIAQLWGKEGNWKKWPKSMIFARAFSIAAKRTLPEAIVGLNTYEDVVDRAADLGPVEVNAAPVLQLAALPPAAPAEPARRGRPAGSKNAPKEEPAAVLETKAAPVPPSEPPAAAPAESRPASRSTPSAPPVESILTGVFVPDETDV